MEQKKHMKEARQGHTEMIQEIKNNFKRHFAQVKSSLDEVTWKLKQQQIKKRKLDEHSGIAVWSDVRTGRIHVQDGHMRRSLCLRITPQSVKQSWDCSSASD